MLDLIIIGGGPAGIAAGVYAARKQLATALLTYALPNQRSVGGQSVVSEDVQNWIGTVSVTGDKLATILEEHLRAYAGDRVSLDTHAEVTRVAPTDRGFFVSTAGGPSYESRTILVASGSTRRKITVPGANIFEHKGITYCASCDGPLFAGRDVAVIGGGNAGFETAAQLLAYAKSVTLLDVGAEFKADPVTITAVLADPKMTGIVNAELQEVKGDQFVTALVYKDRVTGDTRELPAQGVFVEIGLLPATAFMEGIVEINERKQIVIDPWTQRASRPGIWAAGDCTNALYHQNNIAAGDAVRALEDIYVSLKTK